MKTHSNSENKKVTLHTTKNIKTKQIFKLLFLFYRDFFFIRLYHTCHSAVFFVSYKFLSNVRSAFAHIRTLRKINDNRNDK